MSRPMPEPDPPARDAVHNPHSRTEQPPPLSAPEEIDELDRLYRQALDAMDAVESGLDQAAEFGAIRLHQPEADPAARSTAAEAPPSGDGQQESGERDVEASPPSRASDERRSGDALPAGPAVTPQQVIEAALFVGGTDLTTKKLCLLLRGEFDAEFVHAAVDDLNARYTQEGRPYEICFGEGGYRMVLRPEFDRLRYKVFGLGPREVKLSQEGLEVLALVAYRQPLSPEEIAELARPNVGAVLRQLLRRELIALERDEQNPKCVMYRTTGRFLELFGLSDLDELPQAEELNFK